MSKNSNLLGVYTVILTDKKTIKGTHVMVTDFDGNMIWENSIVTDFKGGGYYVDDIAVSDEGELTVVLNSKTINKENEVSNQEIILVIANENDIHQEVIDFSDYNITSAKTLLKSDGNYFVAAYGREINDGNFNGCFFTTFDTELNELNVMEEKRFEDVIEKESYIRCK